MSCTNPISSMCTLAFRTARPRASRAFVAGSRRPILHRSYADSSNAANDPTKLPEASKDDPIGPNMAQAEHVSEEAAKTAKIMGQEGPDVEGQGTPVQEILKNEPATRENAPKVLKSETKRSFSTMARRMQPEITGEPASGRFDPSMIPTPAQRALYAVSETSTTRPGHKFPMPTAPITRRVKRPRNEPIIPQLTKLMMKHGELAKAQRWMDHILTVLRTNPPPTYMPGRPLLPSAPPATSLPLDPAYYLTLAVDSVAPLMRLRSQKGAAGGGMSLQIPIPLSERQRRRQAFHWILDAAAKKRNKGSGKYMFAQKVADEIVSIVEGKSAIWQRRDGVHRLTTAARINVNFKPRGGRR